MLWVATNPSKNYRLVDVSSEGINALRARQADGGCLLHGPGLILPQTPEGSSVLRPHVSVFNSMTPIGFILVFAFYCPSSLAGEKSRV